MTSAGSGRVSGVLIKEHLVIAGLKLKNHVFGAATQVSNEFSGSAFVTFIRFLIFLVFIPHALLGPDEYQTSDDQIDT